ncbi:MAG: hypothetical protein DLM60_14265 [Pseudonocardiales bacterium]|nr:MAG: hypothetical protein DLM60_14265 [Pseudonocardiales bacterium]
MLAAERVSDGVPGGHRLPVTEVLGYLFAVVAATTWLVGARIADGSELALIRRRGARWFASSVAVAALAGEVVSDVAHAGESTVWLSAGAAAAVHAALLWRLRDRPAQHFACLAGVLVAAGDAADIAGGPAAVGLAVAAAGAAWVAGGWMAVLPPPVLALVGGGIAVLAGAGITVDDWSDGASPPNPSPMARRGRRRSTLLSRASVRVSLHQIVAHRLVGSVQIVLRRAG